MPQQWRLNFLDLNINKKGINIRCLQKSQPKEVKQYKRMVYINVCLYRKTVTINTNTIRKTVPIANNHGDRRFERLLQLLSVTFQSAR